MKATPSASSYARFTTPTEGVGKSPRYPQHGRMGGPKSGAGSFEEQTIHFPLPGFEFEPVPPVSFYG
jgi:hypothetical protein